MSQIIHLFKYAVYYSKFNDRKNLEQKQMMDRL